MCNVILAPLRVWTGGSDLLDLRSLPLDRSSSGGVSLRTSQLAGRLDDWSADFRVFPFFPFCSCFFQSVLEIGWSLTQDEPAGRPADWLDDWSADFPVFRVFPVFPVFLCFFQSVAGVRLWSEAPESHSRAS